MVFRWVGQLIVAFALSLLAAGQGWAAEPGFGDILACDLGGAANGALLVLDPVTGQRRVLSDLDDPAQGPLGYYPWDVVRDSRGAIALLDKGQISSGRPSVFEVDSVGRRTLLSDFGDPAQGPTTHTVWAIAEAADGSFVVTSGGGVHLLLAVDRETGNRTVLSDFVDPAQGPVGSPSGVVRESSGDYLVTAYLETGTSVVLRVEAGTGHRSLVADFGPPDTAIMGLPALTLDADGQALVVWSSTQWCFGEVYRVDPMTGERTLLAVLNVIHPWDIAVEPDGRLLVAGYHGGFCGPPGFNRLYRVDPVTGTSTLLASDVNSGLAVATGGIFRDGFESGDLSAWSP